MDNQTIKNWIPYTVNYDDDELKCEWIYLGNKTFTDPFFHESIARCRILEQNKKLFYSTSTLNGLIEYQDILSYLKPKAFIFHVSRCGSTLLTQLLSLDKGNIVLAEPPIFDEILRELKFKSENTPSEIIDESLIAVLKYLGQIRTGDEKNLFVKLDSWHILYYDKLRQLFPNTPFIFSYRRPDEVIHSQLKNSGMHATPAAIQPEIFGFTLQEVLSFERPVYIAKVLEKYFEQYLSIKEKDLNTLFINYADGILPNLAKIQQFLNLDIELDIKQKMIERTKYHSKSPNTVFSEPQLQEKLPEYIQKVFNMYEILAQK